MTLVSRVLLFFLIALAVILIAFSIILYVLSRYSLDHHSAVDVLDPGCHRGVHGLPEHC